MALRLLVVKDAFPLRGGGVEVLPPVASDRLPPSPFPVKVRAPDGGERSAMATAKVAHMRGPLPPFAMLRLADLALEAVPPGAEVWLDD
jgi:hypothetical protein